MSTFTYRGQVFDLFNHPHNTTAHNERAVEIPLAVDYATRRGIDLEVGNVLGHYGITGHRVVDRYEEAPGVDNRDVLDLEDRVGSVVSISTLEHVRWDEPDKDPTGAILAYELLRRIAEHGFVTVPLGHQIALDVHLRTLGRGVTLIRDGDGWVETPALEWRPYGLTTDWAESVYVEEW